MQNIVENKFSIIADYVQSSVFPGLSQHLYYHNISHTMKDVLPVSIRLAEMEAVSGDDLLILKVAVLFHDVGFIKQYFSNESIGVENARIVLPKFDFSQDQISRVGKLIMATRVTVQDGKFIQMAGDDVLEKIICDADLDNFGRDDFFEKSDLIRTEMARFGKTMSDKDWFDYQILLLETHEFLTFSGKKLRADGQLKNLARLKKSALLS
jgi:predicted metal-dependent HD superfamily phosphohydrolase